MSDYLIPTAPAEDLELEQYPLTPGTPKRLIHSRLPGVSGWILLTDNNLIFACVCPDGTPENQKQWVPQTTAVAARNQVGVWLNEIVARRDEAWRQREAQLRAEAQKQAKWEIKNRARAEEKALDYRCPKCGVDRGRRCRAANGYSTSIPTPHSERIQLAMR